MNCPQCQITNPDEARFCMNCGQKLAERCSQCNTILPAEAKFCFNCGARVGQAPSTPSPGAERITPSEATSPTRPRLESRLAQYIPRELLTRLEAARSTRAMEGERRVVTMLFCDVHGSTSAAGQLDPEEWTEVINGAFEHMIRPVYHYEGTVARLTGDGILAFFGAPIAHEDDPQRAVMAGLGIVGALEPYRTEVQQRWGVLVDVRVGINTGLVVVGEVGSDLRMEYTAMGDAINLAARMEQSAMPGSVQISEHTYRLVAPLFEFDDLGEIQVKGKEEPVHTYRVIGRKAKDGRLRGIDGLEAPLTGRIPELQKLTDALTRLSQGVGGLVCLVGEAGLGKSRLVRETQARWQGSDPFRFVEVDGRENWFETAAFSYETEQPYGLFQRLLRRVCHVGRDEPAAVTQEKIAHFLTSLPEQLRPQAGEVLETFFGLAGGSGPGRLEGESFRRLLFEIVRSYWRTQAAVAPLVLVFDDLHWADPASIDLLAHLLPLTDQVPILLLCAMRPDRHAPAWEMIQQAETEFPHRFTEIALQPLTEQESQTLVDNMLTVLDIPVVLRRRILEKTEGNPFFIEEVIRSLIDRGALVRDEQRDRWVASSAVAEIDIPDNLQALLVARIDRLEDEARQTLQLAAVIGRNFYYRVLERIADIVDALDRQLLNLQRAELILESTRQPELEYVFRHVLTQEAAYNTILLKRRREFHRRVGKAIEMLFPEQLEAHAATLGRHFSEANDPEQAMKYYTMAGDVAFRLYANAEAVAHYTHALHIARNRADMGSEQLIYLFSRRGRALELQSEYPQALENYQEMETLAGERDDRAMRLAALQLQTTVYAIPSQHHDAERSEHLAEQALALARELDDREAEARSYWNLQLTYQYSGRPDESIVAANRALAIARELELSELRAFILNDLSIAYVSTANVALGVETLTESAALWQALGNQVMLADNQSTMIYFHTLAGELEQAVARAEEVRHLSRSVANEWAEVSSHSSSLLAYYELGQVGYCLSLVETFLPLADRLSHPATILGRIYLGWIYASLGAVDIGIPLAKRAEELASRRFPLFTNAARVILARLAVAGGDLAAAEAYLEPLANVLQMEGQLLTPFQAALTTGSLALAQHNFTKVVTVMDGFLELLNRKQIRLFQADALGLKGAALLALGQPAAARQTLERAQTIAEIIGSQSALWPILARRAQLESEAGDSATAHQYRQRACSIITGIADPIRAPAVREAFLNRPEVRDVIGT